MVIEHEYVDKVPSREYHFKLTERTVKLYLLIKELSPGKIICLPVDRTLTKRQRIRWAKSTRDRLCTVKKYLGDVFTIRQVDYDIYITRKGE